MMKQWMFATAIFLLPALSALADGTGIWGKGTVQSVDQTTGQVTMAHEAIPAIQWPAMTMPIPVADKALLANMKPGQAIQFELVQDPKAGYVIQQIKP